MLILYIAKIDSNKIVWQFLCISNMRKGFVNVAFMFTSIALCEWNIVTIDWEIQTLLSSEIRKSAIGTETGRLHRMKKSASNKGVKR